MSSKCRLVGVAMWHFVMIHARGMSLWIIPAVLLLSLIPQRVVAQPSRPTEPVPTLAYYYIWFDTTSWRRAKLDLPLLGAYSSDDRQVMQQHVNWAKQAGIDGFIVSWKSTDKLNRRLKQLIEVANEEDFKLSIIYQGLDFERNPLPADKVAADLDYFMANFASDRAFSMFGKPVVIWSGIWKYDRDTVARITGPRRKQLLILASERNVDDYQRVAEIVDGDAYYWSSVDPDTFSGYEEKLSSMGQAVHAQHGLWIAPAAPGFNAKLIGGTRIVDRKDGATLQRQIDAATQSSPDVIGLISWNEFSENSHIEPSHSYQKRYIEVLANIHKTTIGQEGDFDSNAPGVTEIRPGSLVILGMFGLLTLVSVGVIIGRNLRKPQGAIE
jgi:hypothetical protein